MNDNTGHGHVWERPDGVKARCGGPGICEECSQDKLRFDMANAITTSCNNAITFSNIAPAVVRGGIVAYRLMKKKDGELVLQGGYQYTKGWSKFWIEWEDLTTVEE